MAMRIRVRKNDFLKLAAKIPVATTAVVAETALNVNTGAQERSRVDTGTMRRGWHTTMEGPHRAVVSNPTAHTIFNEFGTSRMAAQPMIIPAIENERAAFRAKLTAIFKL